MTTRYRVVGLTALIFSVSLLYSQSGETKQNSADLLRSFKTIYVQSKTPLAKPQMLAGELQKNPNFDAWDLSITNDPGAEVLIEMDHQPGWFYYTYSMTHQSSGIVLAAGRVDAWEASTRPENCEGDHEKDCASLKRAEAEVVNMSGPSLAK